MSVDDEHLQDHVALIAASIERHASHTTDEDLVVPEIRERIARRRVDAPGLSSSLIQKRFALTETEMMVIWALATLTVSARARAVFARIDGDGDPTLRGICQLVYGETASRPAWAELAADGTLRRLGLIESTANTEQHESRQTWALSPRVLALLHGDHRLDPAVALFARLRPDVPREDLVAQTDVFEATRVAIEQRSAISLVTGTFGVGRRTLLATIAREGGRSVLELDASRLAKSPAESTLQLRAFARECKFLRWLPLLGNLDVVDGECIARIGSELVAQLDGPILATCGPNRPTLRWGRPVVVVEMGKPTSTQLGELWLRKLGQGSVSDAELLATKYPLAPALIHHAAEAAKARAAGRDLTPDDIYAGIRTVLDDKLGEYARRVTVTQTWEDIVLPAEQLDAVAELIARVRGRRRVYEQWGFAAKIGKGLGVSALFSGPPGTGKTMVAALIAKELGLELYQVDLAKVVSKWIGETEKNLAALFDAAEAGHAILLFDEADALFGKRTDVKSSNDRNANMETNYLLQRLESFTGICLLTSNHESHIDPAFQRRLSLHLRFELPGVDERAMLWRAMLPQAAPVAPDVDVDALAKRYVMSGGYIRNAALRAAFVAADADSPITRAHLERAAQCEYEGMGKIA